MKSSEPIEVFADSSIYALDSIIAEGGMGSVYEARQLGTEGFSKAVALKMILPRLSESEQFVKLFIGEAKLVADLVHENIVQVYQLGQADGRYYIAMEFVDGINLGELIKQHRKFKKQPEPDMSSFIVSRVCRALHYAHEKQNPQGEPLNIVHRDVSPRNILIHYEGVVKLTDFGIAKATEVMETPSEGSVLMGKLAYMSPEQGRMKVTDRRSDVFSLGLVMFELLTGIRPFFDRDREKILRNVQEKPIPDPLTLRRDLPPELARITMKALTRDLSRRYQTAGEMGNDLEHYMYHDRYGPTNEKLARYLKELFPVQSRKRRPHPRPVHEVARTVLVSTTPDSSSKTKLITRTKT